MRFEYERIIPGDDRQRIPIVPITIFGPRESIRSYALVDSGSDHNIVDESFTSVLGISLEHAQPVLIGTLGGIESSGLETEVERQLGRNRRHPQSSSRLGQGKSFSDRLVFSPSFT